MSPRKSLWPDDLVPSTRSLPEDVLRAQAEDLAVKTKGLLRGEVEPGSQGEWVTINFYVVAPRLNEYTYRLFKARHKVPDPFDPIQIIVGSKDTRQASSEREFEKQLSEVFNSEATRALIGALLALSAKAPEAGRAE